MNIFNDQRIFMLASDQSVEGFNSDQFKLYVNLIKEEMIELDEAIDYNDRVEMFDALLDIVVVAVGAMHSLGVDAESGWQEVIRSNMSKVDAETGKVLKREDGKVLKPATFSAPELKPYVQ